MASLWRFTKSLGPRPENAIRRLYADVFSTPNGRLVLAHLIETAILRKPDFLPQQAAGERATTPLDLAFQRGAEDLAKQIAERAGVGSEDLSRAIATDHLKENDHG